MSNGIKMPKRYRQKERERKRDSDVRLAAALGFKSRHLTDPKGSRRWIETGIWDKPEKETRKNG
jgi:hypothetical protein